VEIPAMIVLLPPSETKEFGTNTHKMNLAKLSFPALTDNRNQLVAGLILLSKNPKKATSVLGISQKQFVEVENNQILLNAKTSPAIAIYSGVLFDAFDYKSLTKGAKNRADQSVVITSALFGLLRLQDSIPHYRLSGDAVLPKIGNVSKTWNSPTKSAIEELNPELIVDMRSGIYAKFWQPSSDLIEKSVVIKIMSRVGKGKNAKKIAISHSNKMTKGLLARDLVSSAKQPKTLEQLVAIFTNLGWDCEMTKESNKPATIEVFI